MLNDLRIALRGLRRSPGLAAVAVLVIGLRIGAAGGRGRGRRARGGLQPRGTVLRLPPPRPVADHAGDDRAGPDRRRALTLARPAEQVVWEISRDAPAYGATTMEQILADTDWRPRFLLQLLAVFAVLALALATSGIYAVLAAAVVEPTREVGIRVAVGARRGDVLALVLAEAGRLALAGIAVGVVLAAAASRLLAGQLQGVGTLDPPTSIAVSALLLAVALAAGAIPALRATRIDPVTALRSD